MINETTIKNLQTALAKELTAAHQYQLHAGLLSAWGIESLVFTMRHEMQEELGHSDEFMSRLLFLKGEPSMVCAKVPAVAKSLVQMFESDLADEKEAITFYTSSARQAGEADDIGTRSLFEQIVLDEEMHMTWLELQLDLIKRIGEPSYISNHISHPKNSHES